VPVSGFADLFGAHPTATGYSITPETALQAPVVYASVKVLAESVAQLPLHVYQRTEDGGRERATDTRLYELLRWQPNAWTTAFEFRQQLMTDLLLRGNAFAFINRTGDGRLMELVQIPAAYVSVQVDELTLEPRYLVTLDNGGQRTYSRDEVLHVKTFGPRHYIGLSPIEANREAVGLVLAMEAHAAGLFGNGARPGGVIEYAKSLTPKIAQRLKESFDAQHGGARKSGKTLILEDGMQFKPLTMTSADAQFLEMRRLQVAEIARVFRIPLHLLQDLERTTHANAESLGQQFLTFTLLPYLHNFEEAIRRSLLTREERQTYFAEFLVDDLTRADIGARFEAYAKAIENGILNPNEARAAENRAPYEGGGQFRRPMNTEVPGDGNA
jgi:HK97 family phage portal protein